LSRVIGFFEGGDVLQVAREGGIDEAADLGPKFSFFGSIAKFHGETSG
jgi:hypothetical protein